MSLSLPKSSLTLLAKGEAGLIGKTPAETYKGSLPAYSGPTYGVVEGRPICVIIFSDEATNAKQFPYKKIIGLMLEELRICQDCPKPMRRTNLATSTLRCQAS